MKYVLNAITSQFLERNQDLMTIINKYLIAPIKAGVFGFALFFSMFSATKLFSFGVTSEYNLNLGLVDVSLSLIGFLILFLIKLLTNHKNINETSH